MTDRFFTKPEIAKECIDFLYSTIPCQKETFLEPTAGRGAFLPYIGSHYAYDVYKYKGIQEMNIYNVDLPYNDLITIGCPPLGEKFLEAAKIFNFCTKLSQVIAFIFPVSYMKYSYQHLLDYNFKLKAYKKLPENSFIYKNKDFLLRTVFQVWVKTYSKYDNNTDLRVLAPAPIFHEDVKIWQYNKNNPEVLDTDWDIALYRQGKHNYNHMFFPEDYNEIKSLMSHTQFFFIKYISPISRDVINTMDFNELAARNTSLGFGKGDFVEYYIEKKREIF